MNYIVTTSGDLKALMSIRLEMLREVNNLPDDYSFNKELIENTEQYFKDGNQTTILAVDEKAIGCATLSYLCVMPTYSHPTGKRAHLMNVYTNKDYRRMGIAETMVKMLINEARKRGVTEISLDATEAGKPLYKKLGFSESDECMTICL